MHYFGFALKYLDYLNYLNLEGGARKSKKCRNHASASETDTPMILYIYDSRLMNSILLLLQVAVVSRYSK